MYIVPSLANRQVAYPHHHGILDVTNAVGRIGGHLVWEECSLRNVSLRKIGEEIFYNGSNDHFSRMTILNGSKKRSAKKECARTKIVHVDR